MQTKDRTENIMIFDCDVHMAAKVEAFDDRRKFVVCNWANRSDWIGHGATITS